MFLDFFFFLSFFFFTTKKAAPPMRAIRRTTPITIPATAPFERPAENEKI
jgi:hypothetical protein